MNWIVSLVEQLFNSEQKEENISCVCLFRTFGCFHFAKVERNNFFFSFFDFCFTSHAAQGLMNLSFKVKKNYLKLSDQFHFNKQLQQTSPLCLSFDSD